MTASALAGVSAFLTVCGFNPSQNVNQLVYGSPPAPAEKEVLDPETAVVPEEFDPADNVMEDVYGPPIETPAFDPADNILAPVYGSPEWFH